MDTPEWKNIQGLDATNNVLDGDGFYISYNPSPNFLGFGFFGSDGGQSETALVKTAVGARSTFYILNGDFRRDYEKLVPQGFDACLAFYNSQKAEHRSSWSDDEEAA